MYANSIQSFLFEWKLLESFNPSVFGNSEEKYQNQIFMVILFNFLLESKGNRILGSSFFKENLKN